MTQRKWIRMLLFLVATLFLYISIVVVVNRQPAATQSHSVDTTLGIEAETLRLGEPIKILTWNIGYAGLGQKSDFFADGGRSVRPTSRAYVRENLSGIVDTIENANADFTLVQELAGPSFINHQVDLRAPVQSAVRGQTCIFSADIQSRLLPRPFNLQIGNATYSRFELGRVETRRLPLESPLGGVLRNNHRMLVSRVPIAESESSLVIVNLHLAAFDADADVRFSQLKVVREFLEHEYQNKNYVIAGGDWNMRLVETRFPHSTQDKHLFWIADLPPDNFPEGWRVAADERVPSVRTLHESYVRGVNYTCVVDGFILSPNIRQISVDAIDLEFRYSDHQPVVLVAELR